MILIMFTTLHCTTLKGTIILKSYIAYSYKAGEIKKNYSDKGGDRIFFNRYFRKSYNNAIF